MQAEHLRSWADFAAKGVEMSRLCIATWEIAGQCDIRAMTHVINAHLRRHDTFHSWFEYHRQRQHRPADHRQSGCDQVRAHQAWRDDAG